MKIGCPRNLIGSYSPSRLVNSKQIEQTSRRIENRAYSDAHFMLIGFSMVRKCHWHCSETTIFSIIIFVQQDKTVLKLVTNFDTCLCFASAKRVFFARDLRRQKFAGCIFKLPVGISLLLSLL